MGKVYRNGNLTNTVYDTQHQIIPISIAVLSLVLIFLITLLGNGIVALIIIRKRRMQTFTNWLILNLAVSDLSVALVCIPLDIPLELYNGKWLYDQFLCSILYPLRSITVFSSIFTLVCLSCTRYWAIIHPFRKQPRKKIAKLFIILIWLVSFVAVIPYIVTLKYNRKTRQCEESWSKESSIIYTMATFVFTYLLPLLLIAVAYTFIVLEMTKKTKNKNCLPQVQEKVKEGKTLINLSLIITITFAVCVLPYHITWLYFEFGDARSVKYFQDIRLAAYLLLYLNSALNPVIYNVFSANFREAITHSYREFVRMSRKYSRQRSNKSSVTRISMVDQIHPLVQRLSSQDSPNQIFSLNKERYIGEVDHTEYVTKV